MSISVGVGRIGRVATILFLMAILVHGTPAVLADELTVFSGRKERFIKPVIDTFTKETGTVVNVRYGSSSWLLNLLSFSADKQVDIYLSNDAGNLQRGSDMGLFSGLPQDVLNTIPSYWRDENGTWIGLSARARVLVVNKSNSMAAKVDSIFDLGKAGFGGKLAITKSSNESFLGGLSVYVDQRGRQLVRDWLVHLKKNAQRKYYHKHSQIVADVAQGKKLVGLVNHYYAYNYLAKHPQAPLQVIYPDQGRHQMGVATNVSGIAILKHSKNRKSAEQFIRYLLSRRVQTHFVKVNKEFPVLRGVPVAKGIPSVSSLKIANTPLTKLGREREQTQHLLNLVGLK